MLSKKTVVFLAALLALLLAADRLADRLLAGRGPVGTLPPTLLDRPDASPFSSVVVSNGAAAVRAVRLPDGRWRLSEPVDAPADAASVGLVLETVARARVLDRVTARQRAARGLTPADYGFDPPRASAVLGREGLPSVLVEFGADTPAGDGVFVRVGGSADVYAVDRAALAALPGSPDDLRDRVLFVPSGRIPVSVTVRDRGRGEIRLESGDGSWTIAAPYRCAASPAAVEPLLHALSTCVAERFVAPREAVDAGLAPDETELVLSIRLEGEARDRDFAFGKPDPATPAFVYVSALSGGTCATVDRTVVDALRMPLDVLREHRILPYGREELRGLALESSAGVFELVREGEGSAAPWTIRRPSRQPADESAVAAFLDVLLAMRDVGAEPAPAEAPPALESAVLSLEPFPPRDRQSFEIRLEAAPDGSSTNLVVCSNDRSLRQFVSAATIPAAVSDPAGLASLRSKTVLALPAGSIPEEPPAVAALLADFRARAVAALAPVDSSAWGLLPPRAERTVRTTLPDRPVVILQFGSKLPDGGSFLRVKGSDEIFEIDPEAAALLLEETSGENAP